MPIFPPENQKDPILEIKPMSKGPLPHLPRCGAKTRKGQPCRQPAMKNGKCYLHGGKATGPPRGSRNALKTGAHVRPLPADQERFQELRSNLGSLDAEITLARFTLEKLLRQMQEQERKLELVQFQDTGKGQHPGKTAIFQHPDFDRKIIRFTNLIGQMEETRQELLKVQKLESQLRRLTDQLEG